MSESADVRPPSAGERAVIARRAARRMQGVLAIARSQRNEVLQPGIIISLMTLGAGLLLPWRHDQQLGRAVMMAASAFGPVLIALGWRRARRIAKEQLAAIAADEARQASGVRDLRFTARRAVTATDANGDGRAWWLFELADGGWLALYEAQWTDLGVGPLRAEVHAAFDRDGAMVALDSAGAELPIERRDLQPPDFAETPRTLYWSPPDDGARTAPIRVTGDPTLDPAGAPPPET